MHERTCLLNKPDVLPQPVKIQRVDGPPVQLDSSRRGGVPSLDQADDGALAGAALPLVGVSLHSQESPSFSNLPPMQ